MKRRARSKRKPVRVTLGAKAHAESSAKRPRRRRSAVKASPDDFADALIDGAAQALGLTIEPAWRRGVAFNLRLVLDHAARVNAFALPDDAEPAPVFHA